MFERELENKQVKTQSLQETGDSISFSSVSFFPYGRGFVWYTVYLSLLVVTVYFSIKYSAPLFSAILVFVSGFYLASTLSEPKSNKVTITKIEIHIEGQSYPIKDFTSYWIEPHGMNFGFLHIYKSKQVLANKEIPYLNIDTALLREFMSEVLADNQSNFSHSVARLSHILKI